MTFTIILKKYDNGMREWISELKEGQSAFDNKNPEKDRIRL